MTPAEKIEHATMLVARARAIRETAETFLQAAQEDLQAAKELLAEARAELDAPAERAKLTLVPSPDSNGEG